MGKMKKISIFLLAVLLITSIFPNMIFANELDKDAETELKGKEISSRDYQKMLVEKAQAERELKELQEKTHNMQRELEGFRTALGDSAAQKVPVLLYHHILPQKDIDAYGWKNNHSVISLEAFEAQMKYLKDNNYFTVTAKEIEKYAKGEMKLPEKTVAITFDDAYISVIDYAYPILEKYGFKSTIFVIGDTIEREREEFDPSSLQRMYVKEKDLYKNVFDYESHTYSLHDFGNGMTALEKAEKQEIYADTGKMKQVIQSYILAYPGGRNNEKIVEAIKTAGYTSAFTIKSGYVRVGNDLYRMPRIVIGPNMNMERFTNIVTGKVAFN